MSFANVALIGAAHPLWPDMEVQLEDGTVFLARTIVVATGARYKKPTAVNLDRFAGRGAHYGATHLEAQLCGGKELIVVGGGNSAGQAAVFLAEELRFVRARLQPDRKRHRFTLTRNS